MGNCNRCGAPNTPTREVTLPYARSVSVGSFDMFVADIAQVRLCDGCRTSAGPVGPAAPAEPAGSTSTAATRAVEQESRETALALLAEIGAAL